MAHKTLALIAAVSLAGILYLVYLALTFESPQGTRTVEIEQPVPRPVESVEREAEQTQTSQDSQPSEDEESDADSREQTSEPNLALQPIPEPESSTDESDQAAEEPEPLPSLNESDEFVRTRLTSLEVGTDLLEAVTPEQIIRRFVVFTDNVARGELPQLEYPVTPPEETMPVREVDDNLYEMTPEAHRRFDPIVDTLVSVDLDDAMAIYRRAEPLFQQAYSELGYDERDFDDVAIEAIDAVLEAETVEGPYQLIRPSVHYEFAESSIEQMSPLSKQLMRLGPENTARLRERLRDYRERLQSPRRRDA